MLAVRSDLVSTCSGVGSVLSCRTYVVGGTKEALSLCQSVFEWCPVSNVNNNSVSGSLARIVT